MRPYLALHRSHCFVLAEPPNDASATSHESRAVGYLLLAPSTEEHYHRVDSEYLPSLPKDEPLCAPPGPSEDPTKPQGYLAIAMRSLLHSPLEELARLETKYSGLLKMCPAHLHIDILDGYQGHGWGKRLIEDGMEHLRQLGVKGVHLSMAEDNARARRFYEERCGFRRWREKGAGEWVLWRTLLEEES